MWHHNVSYLDKLVDSVMSGLLFNQRHVNDVETEYIPLDCEYHTNVEQGCTLHCGRVKHKGEFPTAGQYNLQRMHVCGKRYSDER